MEVLHQGGHTFAGLRMYELKRKAFRHLPLKTARDETREVCLPGPYNWLKTSKENISPP
jgi:hypothetical protein